jgi:general secretion pathway protein D
VNNAADAVATPVQIQFDPKLLRLNDISSGDFMAQGGQQPVFAKNIQNDSGTATIELSRPAGAPGASGTGVLMTLSFQAVARGNTSVTIPNLIMRNSQNQSANAGNASLPVRIQ